MYGRKKQFASKKAYFDTRSYFNDWEDNEPLYTHPNKADDVPLSKAELLPLEQERFQTLAFKKILEDNKVKLYKYMGVQSQAVAILQRTLHELGYGDVIDEFKDSEGWFYKGTAYAVARFQTAHGLPNTQVVDAETLRAMDKALGDFKQQPESNEKIVEQIEQSLKSKINKDNKLKIVSKNPKILDNIKGNSIKLGKCGHADDYCLSVSFIAAKDIPAGDTIEGYAIYYQAVYGGSELKAMQVANFWGEGERIDFSKAIKAGTQTSVSVPVEKYLDNLFFGAPENDPARQALKKKLLELVDKDDKNNKVLDKEEVNAFLTEEYSKLTEDVDYKALKDKVKDLKLPELSQEGKNAAQLLEKDAKNENAAETLIEEFEKFGKQMALFMLQLNRKLLLTEAERHGIWLPYGEKKDKLDELKTDIQVYKLQMATIQANLPSFAEQQNLHKEAYDAIGKDPFATDIHDQNINKATGIDKKHNARNTLYNSSPILSLGDNFNQKGLDREEDWAVDWENFDLKTDAQIITALEHSIIKQLEFIDEAEKDIKEEDTDFIWDVNEIIPISIQQAGILENTNAVNVIQAKVRQEAKYQLIKNIFLIAGGIILTIVSLGKATPFLLALLAGGGALAISIYYVKKDIHDYQLNQNLYDASLQFGQVLQDDDPTLLWVGLSLLGALGDAAQVIRLLKAARATNTVYKTLITLSKQEGLTAKEITALDGMISKTKNIGKLYNTDEIMQLASTADRLGLTSTELIHHVYIGGRLDKPLTATELMAQLKTWKHVIKPRKYPFKFNNKLEFNAFSKFFIQNLKKIKVPVYDVRVQGSSLRTPKANDVDLAIMLTQDDFAEHLIKAFNGKVKLKTGEIIELSGKSYEELNSLGNHILKNKDSYVSTSKTFRDAILNGKISSKSFKTIKTPFLKDFREARIALTETYKNLNIDDIVLQPVGGNFDLQPYFKLSEQGIETFDILDLLPFEKSIKLGDEINQDNE